MKIDRVRYLGLAGERCPRCGDEIETLLNSEGRDPIRCCWRCEAEIYEQENKWYEQQMKEKEHETDI